MKYSVLLSLHDRDVVDLQKTFKQLAKAASGRDDVEFVIVHDSVEGQFAHCEQLAEMFRDSIPNPVIIEWYDTLSKHDPVFNLDGHNNPVAVNNRLMELASGDNLVWISSDMIVSPMLFERIDLHCNDDGILDTIWCSRVLDQDGMAEFCGPSRPFPMMWCLAHPAYGTLQHDLQLLQGFGFDDNDWVARVALKVGSIAIDLLHIGIHQTHGRVSKMGQLASGKAYSIEAKDGWERSLKYMRTKWGGIPFDGKTLDIEYGEIGDFIILNVNGVKSGADLPLDPAKAEQVAFATEEPDPIGRAVPKKTAKKARKRRVKKS